MTTTTRWKAVTVILLLLKCFVVSFGEDVGSVEEYDEAYWDQMQEMTNDPEYGVSWTFMPDGLGFPRVAYLKENRTHSRMRAAKGNVNFYLYTRGGNREGKELETIPASANEFKNFDPRKWTIFLIHGWQASEGQGGILTIRETIDKHLDVNTITVDWSEMASSLLYFDSARRTEHVGQMVAEMIEHMEQEMKLNRNRTHIIGHSLGAHTAGYAGMFLNGTVARITGLDPAGPSFYLKGPDNRLDPTDAQFVDVIHTAVGSAGHYKDLGHVDFYPNGGIYQPGCGGAIILKESCSHSRSQDYLAESIWNNNFYSYPCDNFRSLQKGSCNTSTFVMMGNSVDNSARGRYYLEVGTASPYAKGSVDQGCGSSS